MSLVVGIVDGGSVHLASDSIAYDESGAKEVRTTAKVFERNGFGFGVCGEVRVEQVVRYTLPALQPPRSTQALREHICVSYLVRLRKALVEVGLEGPDAPGWDMLVAHDGRLLKVDSDYVVSETVCGFDAIGSASEPARGALFMQDIAIAAARRAKREHKVSPTQRLLDAMTVGEKCTNVVHKPYMTLTIPPTRRR